LVDNTSAHEAWNIGANIATSVNYLDFSGIQEVIDHDFTDGKARFPCSCPGVKKPKGMKLEGDAQLYDPETTTSLDYHTKILSAVKRLGDRYKRKPLELLNSRDIEDQLVARIWLYLYEDEIQWPDPTN
jgi:hypothetical protein